MWFLQWDNDGTIHKISKKEQNNLKLFCLGKKIIVSMMSLISNIKYAVEWANAI